MNSLEERLTQVFQQASIFWDTMSDLECPGACGSLNNEVLVSKQPVRHLESIWHLPFGVIQAMCLGVLANL
jgi:hypothetical protein